ncbi:hypothetical protein HJFPF1_06421 [Paramyrothecium foliicola]|nr:hypothetical protein HJFPF1_06421 [Paramyrothecium foliicola]
MRSDLALLPASPELQPQGLITLAKLHYSIEFIGTDGSSSASAVWHNMFIVDVFIVDFVIVSEALGIRPPYWIILL